MKHGNLMLLVGLTEFIIVGVVAVAVVVLIGWM